MKEVDTVAILKSLADETRLSIVKRLAELNSEAVSVQIVTECSAALKLSQPTMSHHFSKLVNSGVLLERKDGIEKLYRLNKELLSSVGIDPAKL